MLSCWYNYTFLVLHWKLPIISIRMPYMSKVYMCYIMGVYIQYVLACRSSLELYIINTHPVFQPVKPDLYPSTPHRNTWSSHFPDMEWYRVSCQHSVFCQFLLQCSPCFYLSVHLFNRYRFEHIIKHALYMHVYICGFNLWTFHHLSST